MRSQILNQLSSLPIVGRRFTAEDLQLMLLNLIADEPRHGYELIKALQTRSNGFYKPSPGMVYPALTYLEEIGLVTVETEGNRKRYSIAEEGRAHLDANREQIDAIFAKLESAAGKMDSVRRAFAGEESTEDERSNWLPEFAKARQALRKALAAPNALSAEAQRRVAEILRRAADAIETSLQNETDAGTAASIEAPAAQAQAEAAQAHSPENHTGTKQNPL
jgi:DNA-binding PadR family transcriptional regulator